MSEENVEMVRRHLKPYDGEAIAPSSAKRLIDLAQRPSWMPAPFDRAVLGSSR
jgi:hypothetical protein